MHFIFTVKLFWSPHLLLPGRRMRAQRLCATAWGAPLVAPPCKSQLTAVRPVWAGVRGGSRAKGTPEPVGRRPLRVGRARHRRRRWLQTTVQPQRTPKGAHANPSDADCVNRPGGSVRVPRAPGPEGRPSSTRAAPAHTDCQGAGGPFLETKICNDHGHGEQHRRRDSPRKSK